MIVPPRTSSCLKSLLALILGVFLLFAPVQGQFRAGVDLVEIYATVADAAGRPVTGLSPAEFLVTEDGAPQSIAAFAEGDVPLGVALAVDHSFSVTSRQLAQIARASERFLDALKPADEVMVLAIGSRTEILAPLSIDRALATTALRRLEPWGTTPLFDAVVAAIARIDAASGRRALVLLSDGADRYSELTATAMIEEARRRNVLVYPVILGRTVPPSLTAVARVTGGRVVVVEDGGRLAVELEQIAAELRAQYMLGYSPQAPPPDVPTWRAIRVTVTRPGTSVRAREGYLAR